MTTYTSLLLVLWRGAVPGPLGERRSPRLRFADRA